MKGLLIGVVAIACVVGVLGTIAPHASANAPPDIAITGPAGGFYLAGQPVSVTWNLSDDRDPLAGLFVWVNYTGPTAGPIAGPLAGTRNQLLWMIPSTLNGSGYRITAIAFDAEGASRSVEGPAFTVVPIPKAPTFPIGPSGDEFVIVSFVVASGFLIFLVAAFGPALAGRPEGSGAWKVRPPRRKTALKPRRKTPAEQRASRKAPPGHSRNQ